MPRATVTVAVEGPSDAAVAERLLDHAGLEMGPVHGLQGKALLDRQLLGYNNAARHACWLVLRDLDTDADCAPHLLSRLLPSPARSMRFQIAVRAVEAWLIADRERLGQFLQVPVGRIPVVPDTLPNPKETLVDLARLSRSKAIRQDMVPSPGTSATVGPGFVGRIIEFATRRWRPEAAAAHSDSLRRCLADLKRRSEK
ncbi:MAG: hypothetical protein HY906_00290 [Deltaproteobacteria bacterium]|nr:hypothetical protein [Deltaproteobacteria bacterium]